MGEAYTSKTLNLDAIIDKGGERNWKHTVYMYVHLQS